MSEPRPFDPREIAENLRAGHTVRIGEHFRAAAQDGQLVMVCDGCQHATAVSLVLLDRSLGAVFAFMSEHFHGAKGWS